MRRGFEVRNRFSRFFHSFFGVLTGRDGLLQHLDELVGRLRVHVDRDELYQLLLVLVRDLTVVEVVVVLVLLALRSVEAEFNFQRQQKERKARCEREGADRTFPMRSRDQALPDRARISEPN